MSTATTNSQEANDVSSPNASKIQLQNVVWSIVHQAMITLCGRELPRNGSVNHGENRNMCHDDVDAVVQWRNELFDLVKKTVRFVDYYRNATFDEHELRTKMFDIEIRTPTAFVQRYSKATVGEKGIAKTTTIVSDMGIVRDIHSSYQLASQFLLPMIEHELSARHISDHVRVARQSGFICAISIDMMQFIKEKWQHPGKAYTSTGNDRSLQLESCPCCPLWCKGSKGLWWHLQQQHSIVHSTATATANMQIHRNSTALVVYKEPPKTLPIINVLQPPTERKDSDMCEVHRHETKGVGKCSNNTNNMSLSSVMNNHDCIEDPWQCIKQGPTLEQFVASVSYYQLDCPTARDKHGALILHWAAGGGHLHIVQYLLERAQCDATAVQRGQRAYAGRTALHWAARYGHAPVVEYLLHQYMGMSSFIDARTADGTTPFCWAAWQGHLSVMKLLFSYGCQVNTVNQFGCNAILWAAQGCGDISLFNWLVEVGCPDQVLNHSGHGILHKGAQRGRRDVCVWFTGRMAAWIQKETLFSASCQADASTCLAVLKLLGPDNDGCTPSDLAGMEHHEALAIYLSEQEQHLITLMASSRSMLVTSLPSWLSNAPKSSIYSESERRKHRMTWEPGAGVFRMRSVLNNLR